MQVVHGIQNLKTKVDKTVVTIGNFDGVHLGHQALINKVKEKASGIGASTVVMTFEPHPVKLLHPERPFKRIFPVSDLIAQMELLGVDILVIEPFSRELSELDPHVFVADWVVKPLSPKWLIVGYDFAFGHGRKGSSEFLKSKASEFNYQVEIFPAYKIKDLVVSSSEIRKNIEAGQMATVNTLLGRPFYLEGLIEKGAGRGKTLGFPTANLKTTSEIFPKYGVYATVVEFSKVKRLGITNVGLNPTFIEKKVGQPNVETYVFDWNDDLYGQRMKVSFLDFVRDERKFASKEELREQIKLDIESVKKRGLRV